MIGRVAQAEGAMGEAGRHLTEALQSFVSIGARFEVGRVHLFLTSLASAQGDSEGATAHLNQAHALFRALGAPLYVERTEQLAREFGVSLSKTGVA